MNDSLGAILAIAVLWLIVRFAFGGNSSSSTDNGTNLNNVRARQIPQHMVDTVKTMFPDISEDSIRYDLLTSGSAESTCDRILNQGGLPNPPIGFFGTPPAPAPPPAAPTATTPTSTLKPSTTTNLVSRYGLESKINNNNLASSDNLSNGWASTVEERSQLLQQRKQNMILQARRKLIQKQQLPNDSQVVPN